MFPFGTKGTVAPKAREDRDAIQYANYSARKVANHGPPPLRTYAGEKAAYDFTAGAEDKNIAASEDTKGRGRFFTTSTGLWQRPSVASPASTSSTGGGSQWPEASAVQYPQPSPGYESQATLFKKRIPTGPAAMVSHDTRPIQSLPSAQADRSRDPRLTATDIAPDTALKPVETPEKPLDPRLYRPSPYPPSQPTQSPRDLHLPALEQSIPSAVRESNISAPTLPLPMESTQRAPLWFGIPSKPSTTSSAKSDNSALERTSVKPIAAEKSHVTNPAGDINGQQLNLEAIAAKEGGEQTAMGASKDTEPAAEMVDVKPTPEELEKASSATMPQVRDEDRLEGCVSFR